MWYSSKSGAAAHWLKLARKPHGAGGGRQGGIRGVLIGCPMPNSEVLTSASRELGNAKTVQVGPFAVSGRARGRILAKTFDPLVLPTPSLFQSSCSSPVQSAFPLADTVRIALVILPRPSSFFSCRSAARSGARPLSVAGANCHAFVASPSH